MSPNRRIILNILATYGRSLYALVLGLFCSRWILMSLGEIDYGLMGVIGGLSVFISYLNGILSWSFGRFYAIAVGEEKANPIEGLDSSRKWFTTAVVIQTIMPTILMIICYPVGAWMVQNYLTIPIDRIEDCLWVWRYVCVSCYLGMVCMPWNSMYVAHQYIAELTIYSFATTTLNAFFLYYMVTHPGLWMKKYAFWQCLLAILPDCIICIRAHFLFPECRVVKKYLHCWDNIKKMSAYALWNAWGSLGIILRAQGIAILVNKCFGPRINAGVTVGSNLSGHCNKLASSLIGAFSPAIYNAWGAREYGLAKKLAFQTCKIGTLLFLVFSIPLSLEVDEVLRLWLEKPPEYASGLCLFVMIAGVIDKLAVGHDLCVNANGRIEKYQTFIGTSIVLTLPFAWLLIKLGCGVYSVGWAMVSTMLCCSIGKVYFAEKLVALRADVWIKRVLIPIIIVVLVSFALGVIPRLFLPDSFIRIVVTTLIVECVLMTLSWFIVLDVEEKSFLRKKVLMLIRRG